MPDIKMEHKESLAVLRLLVAESNLALARLKQDATRIRRMRREALDAIKTIESKPRSRVWTFKAKQGRPVKKV